MRITVYVAIKFTLGSKRSALFLVVLPSLTLSLLLDYGVATSWNLHFSTLLQMLLQF